jgi:hypothetical protein
MKEDLPFPESWEKGWQGHELAELRRLARLSFAEKLDCLEQAHGLVRQLQKAREQRGPVKEEDAP